MLEKTLESPLDSKRSKQSILKEINPEYSLEGLKLKLQYFGHLMWRVNSVEKTLMLGKIEGQGSDPCSGTNNQTNNELTWGKSATEE